MTPDAVQAMSPAAQVVTPTDAATPADAVTAAPLSRRARRLAQSTETPIIPSPAGPLAEEDVRSLFEPAPKLAQDADAAVPVEADPAATTEFVIAPEAAVADEPVLAEATAPVDAETFVAAPVQPVVTKPAPASDEDVFARASDAFGFSPVEDSHQASAAPKASRPAKAPAHIAPRRIIRRRIAAAGASLGVMGVAGMIAVSMTLPASAVAAVQNNGSGATASLVASAAPAKKVADDEIQAYVASAAVEDEDLAREGEYSTVSLLDVAAEEGIKRVSNSLYTNDPNAAIQWPFMVGVAMSSPYGMRNGRMHAGIDLVPGAGATIQAIADGTVRIATESGGAYGVTVYVDHVIDGQVVTSHYAHMQHGSLAVKTGQKVKVGDTIGKVGNTGRSYGAHLHFEIIINGSTVDPLAWMRKNAGRYSY